MPEIAIAKNTQQLLLLSLLQPLHVSKNLVANWKDCQRGLFAMKESQSPSSAGSDMYFVP